MKDEYRELGLEEALLEFQRQAPVISKTETVDTTKEGGKMRYNFAGLNTVWAAIADLMYDFGFTWRGWPDLEVLDGSSGQTRLVLRYLLVHVPSGSTIGGTYPLKGERPQEIGSAITYARRYALVAVLNLRVAEDDDDAVAAEQHGQLSPSQQVQAARPRKAAATRTPARPRSAPAPMEEERPTPANPDAPMTDATRRKMFAAMGDLGHSTRDQYGEYINRVLVRHGAAPVSSSTELTQEQAGWVIEAAETAEAGPLAEEAGQPAESEG